MTGVRRARQLILGTYVMVALFALGFVAADLQDVSGLVLVPLATLGAALLAAALAVGSVIGAGALARARPRRLPDVLIVPLGGLGAAALALYAAALGWNPLF